MIRSMHDEKLGGFRSVYIKSRRIWHFLIEVIRIKSVTWALLIFHSKAFKSDKFFELSNNVMYTHMGFLDLNSKAFKSDKLFEFF